MLKIVSPSDRGELRKPREMSGTYIVAGTVTVFHCFSRERFFYSQRQNDR